MLVSFRVITATKPSVLDSVHSRLKCEKAKAAKVQNNLIQSGHSLHNWGIVHSTGQGVRTNYSSAAGQFLLQQQDPVIM